MAGYGAGPGPGKLGELLRAYSNSDLAEFFQKLVELSDPIAVTPGFGESVAGAPRNP